MATNTFFMFPPDKPALWPELADAVSPTGNQAVSGTVHLTRRLAALSGAPNAEVTLRCSEDRRLLAVRAALGW